MNLTKIAKAIHEHDADIIKSPKILLFGPPKVGKTRMVGTLAKLPYVKKVWWFDLENGVETLVNAVDKQGNALLSAEEMAKIEVIQIEDTKDYPQAAETVLKAFSAKKPVNICSRHGKIDCVDCQREKKEFIPFLLRGVPHDEAVVVDSGSQLADSVFNMELIRFDYKDNRKYWGEFFTDMGNILSMIQAANCTVVMITHEIAIENDDGKVIEIAPLCGSRNFSQKISKYFGHTIYKTLELRKYKAISTGMYSPLVKAGTRSGVDINLIDDATMADILNYIPSPARGNEPVKAGAVATATQPQAKPAPTVAPAKPAFVRPQINKP